MKDFADILKTRNYRKISFRITRTNHLLLRASINGVAGNFILDTGASSSCVGVESVEMFGLKTADSETKAAGAGATGMQTQISEKNILRVGTWKKTDFDIVVFDMSHVNTALEEHHARPVQGIIGADVLMLGKAIIDYHNNHLFLLK
ncbi:MAG: acid protease [Flavobacterium sp.]|nr:MAG: acid protease [Flavobacterium sp.]